MIEYILSNFFTINKRSKSTIIINRKTCFEDYCVERRNKLDTEKTCLSSFFINVKGLNVDERLSANHLM